MGISLSCCQGANLTGKCNSINLCQKGQRSRRVSIRRRRGTGRVITVDKLCEVDHALFFDRKHVKDGFNMIINLDGYILTGTKGDIIRGYNAEVTYEGDLRGKHISELYDYMPTSISDIIALTLRRVKEKREASGCHVEVIDGNHKTGYLVCGYPITDGTDLLSVMLMKQAYNRSLHRAYLSDYSV